MPLIICLLQCQPHGFHQRKDEVDKIVRWGKLIQKYGGTVAVIGPDGSPAAHTSLVITKQMSSPLWNDMGKALTNIGLTAALHPHTGTCVEKRDHVYAVLEAVDTKCVKFGPDVGQLEGRVGPGGDCQEFPGVVEHVHLKDWDGGPWEGYCPLGRGKVAIPTIQDLLEKSKIKKSGHDRIGGQECADGADRNGPNRQGLSPNPGLRVLKPERKWNDDIRNQGAQIFCERPGQFVSVREILRRLEPKHGQLISAGAAMHLRRGETGDSVRPRGLPFLG